MLTSPSLQILGTEVNFRIRRFDWLWLTIGSMSRPLTIKNMDLQLSRMIAKFSRHGAIERARSAESIIQESTMDLMELARESLELLTNFKVSIER